jgi:hypothetical protein
MILRGLLPNELRSCLKICQEKYDNNLQFNRLDLSYAHKNDIKGIGAVDMSGEVIIAKVDEKPMVINIGSRGQLFDNPFIKEQRYHCWRIEDVYDVAIYEQGEVFAVRKGLKSPVYVIDFLKHNREITAINFTLRVQDSKKAGHKLGRPRFDLRTGETKGKQRRLVAACWHVHRDVMIEIFKLNPNANLKTAMAHYKNKESFYDLYPGTADINVGSQMYPITMLELCDCGCV